jgi:hypothetical protein
MIQLQKLTAEQAEKVYEEHGEIDKSSGVAIFKFDAKQMAREVYDRFVAAGFSPSINGGGYQIIFTKDETAKLFEWMGIQRGDRSSYENKKIIERDDYTCQVCDTTFMDARPLEVHHVVQSSDGGPHEEENLTTVCIACHARTDGFTVGDFDDDDHRVERAYGYALSEGYKDEAAFLRTAQLLGVTPEKAKSLIEEVETSW